MRLSQESCINRLGVLAGLEQLIEMLKAIVEGVLARRFALLIDRCNDA